MVKMKAPNIHLGQIVLMALKKYYLYNIYTLEVTGNMTCTKWDAPRNSFTLTPKDAKDGYAVIVVLEDSEVTDTEYELDYRGTTIYSTTDGSSKTVTDLGDIPDGYTTLKPSADTDTWDEETDSDGNVTREAGERYGIRQGELTLFLLKYALYPLMDS